MAGHQRLAILCAVVITFSGTAFAAEVSDLSGTIQTGKSDRCTNPNGTEVKDFKDFSAKKDYYFSSHSFTEMKKIISPNWNIGRRGCTIDDKATQYADPAKHYPTSYSTLAHADCGSRGFFDKSMRDEDKYAQAVCVFKWELAPIPQH